LPAGIKRIFFMEAFMKKSKRFLMGMAALLLTFALILAGCATDGGAGPSDGAAGPETAAVPVPGNSLAESLAWLRENAEEGGAYVITVNADEAITPTTLSYDSKTVSITLKGGAAKRTVSLGETGTLFGVERGVTLSVENLTLKGRGNSESAANDSPLVRVNSGGVLNLKADAVITENYNAEHGGGGVSIDGGTFTMEGGEISGNTAKGNGGVFIIEGTFIMENGAISGNTAGEWCADGVGVSGSAIFIMEDGKIRGNTASKPAGGVDVTGNATFIMKAGEISGNTATRKGGGVRVWEGTFIKKGGTIYGDTDTAHTPGSTENTALDGTGHAVLLDGGSRRNADAGEEIKLYAKHENGIWTYNDISDSGVGDTTTNWE
jgi:hypothetical protein